MLCKPLATLQRSRHYRSSCQGQNEASLFMALVGLERKRPAIPPAFFSFTSLTSFTSFTSFTSSLSNSCTRDRPSLRSCRPSSAADAVPAARPADAARPQPRLQRIFRDSQLLGRFACRIALHFAQDKRRTQQRRELFELFAHHPPH